MDDESGAWLTYQEAGDRLGVSPEAARAKAARRRWRRQIGNDGLARVRIPEDERAAGDRQVTTRSREASDRPLIARWKARLAARNRNIGRSWLTGGVAPALRQHPSCRASF